MISDIDRLIVIGIVGLTKIFHFFRFRDFVIDDIIYLIVVLIDSCHSNLLFLYWLGSLLPAVGILIL